MVNPFSRLVVICALGLAGCVQVEQTLTLRADGSGEMRLHYAAPLESVQAMEDMARRAALVEEEVETPLNFDEKAIREDFEAYRPLGVTLDEVSIVDREGARHVDLHILFTSLKGLTETEFISDRSLTLRRIGPDAYELRQQAERPAELSSVLGDAGPEGEALLLQMLKGFRAVVRIEVPGTIQETNGQREGDRVSVWEFRVDEDPAALQRLQQFDLRLTFQGAGLNLPELGAVRTTGAPAEADRREP